MLYIIFIAIVLYCGYRFRKAKEKNEVECFEQKNQEVPNTYKMHYLASIYSKILGGCLILLGGVLMVLGTFVFCSGIVYIAVCGWIMGLIAFLFGIVYYQSGYKKNIRVEGEELYISNFWGVTKKITFQEVSKLVLYSNKKISIYFWTEGHQREKKVVVNPYMTNRGYFETTLKRAIVKYGIKCEKK